MSVLSREIFYNEAAAIKHLESIVWTISQKDKFIDTARAFGCDESEEAFDAKLKKLMTVKPMMNVQVKKTKRNSSNKNGVK